MAEEETLFSSSDKISWNPQDIPYWEKFPGLPPGAIGLDSSGNPVFPPGPKTVAEFGKYVGGYGKTTPSSPGGYYYGVSESYERAERERVARQQKEAEIQKLQQEAQQREIQRKVEEQKKRIEEQRLKQESLRTGKTIQQLQQQRESAIREQTSAVTAAYQIQQSGKAYTSAGYRQELAKQSGMTPGQAVSQLRAGTKAEAQYFKETGFSLSEARREREKNIVSKAVYEDLQRRASADDILAQQQLYRIGGYVELPAPIETPAISQSLFEQFKDNVAVFYGKKKEQFEKAEETFKERVTEPLFMGLKDVSGIDITSQKDVSKYTSKVYEYGLKTWGARNLNVPPEKDILAGLLTGGLKDIKEHPYKNILTVGIGAGIGFGAGAITTGAKAISPSLGAVAKGGEVLAGLGFGSVYALETGKKIKTAKTGAEAGEIFATSLKDVMLFGAGYGAGAKGFQKGVGIVRTIGRKEIITPQGEFPSAPPEKHLELFEKNVIKELGKEPVAFHTTGEKFWKGGAIKPEKGASEIAGLYASTQISTPFARISGSSSSKVNLKSALKSLFEAPSLPAVAVIKPKGFRERAVGFSTGSLFEGQKRIKGRGYAYFKGRTRKGFMDIPKIKSEIEAVATPSAGEYELVSKEYYTKVKGVRVPMDVFKSTEKGAGKVKRGKAKAKVSDIFKPSKYDIASIGKSRYSALSSMGLSSKSISSVSKTSGKSSGISLRYQSSLYKPVSKTQKSYIQRRSRLKSSIVSKSLYGSSGLTSISKKRKSYMPSGYRTPTTKPPKPILYPKGKTPSLFGEKYVVSVRRFGKFSPIFKTGDLQKALSVGKGRTERTLAASFKISGKSLFAGTPSGFYRSRKEAGVFIEKRGRRLKKGTFEIPEIQRARLLS